MRRILLTLPRLLLLVVATATTVSAHHDHHEASVIGGIKGSSGLDGSLRHHSHVNLGTSSLHGQSNRAAGLKWSSEGVAGHSSDLGGMIDSVLRYHQDVKNRMNLDFSGFGKSSVSGQGSGQLIGNGGGAGAGGIGSLLGSYVGSLAGKLNVGGGGGGAADQRATIDDDVGGTGIGSLLGRASGSAGLVGNINVNGRVGGAAETASSVESVGSVVIVDDGATEQESKYENQELGWVIPTQNVEYEIIVRKNDDENDDDRQEILVILDGSKGEEGVSSSIRAEAGPEIERLIILEEPSSGSSNQRLAEQILTIKSSTKDEEEVREEQVPKESSSSSSSSAAVVVSVLPSSILSEVSRVVASGSSAISKPLSYNAAGTSAATAAAGGADAKVNLGLNFNNLNNNNNQARNNEDLHASIAEYTNNLKNSIRTKFGGALDGGLNVKTSGGGGGSGLFNLVNII